jgi:hypothetical protein
VRRTSTGRALGPHEQAVIDAAFKDSAAVSLSSVHRRLMQRSGGFGKAVLQELAAAGLTDTERQAVRRRFQRFGIALVLVAPVSALVLGLFAGESLPWPMLVPIAALVIAVTSLIAYAAHTPLSNQGVALSRQWRAYQTYLREAARERLGGGFRTCLGLGEVRQAARFGAAGLVPVPGHIRRSRRAGCVHRCQQLPLGWTWRSGRRRSCRRRGLRRFLIPSACLSGARRRSAGPPALFETIPSPQPSNPVDPVVSGRDLPCHG